MSGFFEPVTHKYYLLGDRVPSVTQILHAAGHIDDRFYNPQAADRGRRVHAICEHYGNNPRTFTATPAGLVVPDDIGGECDAFVKFCREQRPTFIARELALYYDGAYLPPFAGRTDAIVEIGGFSGVLELKTGAAQKWHGYQLAGYNRLRPSCVRWVCYLEPSGDYRLRRLSDPMDDRIFVTALRETWRTWDVAA